MNNQQPGWRIGPTVLLLIVTLSPPIGRAFYSDSPSFEAAAISHHLSGTINYSLQVDPGQLRVAGWSILAMTMYAYELPRYQIVNPEWTLTETYDIWAKFPQGAKKEDTHAMVRNMLSERFKMTTHWATREGPAYELIVRPSGLKLKPAPAEEPRQLLISMGGYMNAKAYTLTQFCDVLATYLHQPVIDRTKIEGRFDIVIQPGPEFIQLGIASNSTSTQSSSQPLEATLGTSIYPELKELGLGLHNVKASVKYLVIDSVQKEFTAN